jgi:hypothetical protein
MCSVFCSVCLLNTYMSSPTAELSESVQELKQPLPAHVLQQRLLQCIADKAWCKHHLLACTSVLLLLLTCARRP